VPLTILEAAGLRFPTSYQGRAVAQPLGSSMLAHLRTGEGEVHPAGTETGWELFGRRAVRRDGWKALWMRSPEGTGTWQLYDLKADPGETRDRAQDRPDLLAELIEAWQRYVAQVGVVESPVSVFELDPA
jgi:arylsulfatase A-like enzyme